MGEVLHEQRVGGYDDYPLSTLVEDPGVSLELIVHVVMWSDIDAGSFERIYKQVTPQIPISEEPRSARRLF